jgi:hypothetical protein
MVVSCARVGQQWLNQPPEGEKKRGERLGFPQQESGDGELERGERERTNK